MMEDFKITYKGRVVGRIEHMEQRRDALSRETIELRARVDRHDLIESEGATIPSNQGVWELMRIMVDDLLSAGTRQEREEWFKKYIKEASVQQTVSQEIEQHMKGDEKIKMLKHMEEKSRRQLSGLIDMVLSEPTDRFNEYIQVKRYGTAFVNLKAAMPSLKPADRERISFITDRDASIYIEPTRHEKPKSLLDQIGDL